MFKRREQIYFDLLFLIYFLALASSKSEAGKVYMKHTFSFVFLSHTHA